MLKTIPERSLRRQTLRFTLFALLVAVMIGCERGTNTAEPSAAAGTKQAVASRQARLSKYKPVLSDYGLFVQPLNELKPAVGVMEYELNTPLFTDYAQKQRVIKIPEGTKVGYTSSGSLDFPVGTIIAKSFFYAEDLNDSCSSRKLVETRILELTPSGWVGIPYVWNAEQTEARLAIAGATVDVAWIHTDGQQRNNSHAVPNLNDCKRCHTNLEMKPIGPKASNLNRDFVFASGAENQLVHWARIGFLSGLPDLDEVPRLARWDDESVCVDHRARAYLDVNCALCHNEQGPARNSGLHLNLEETNPYRLGTFKTPIAAGKGTGGRLYGIVPGKPDESIMEYRMRTIQPGEIMPEFGKSLVHEEGLALIRSWIAEMN